MGYSLGMSAVPLDTDSLYDEDEATPTKGEDILKHARYLYSQYLSTRMSPDSMGTGPGVMMSDIEHIVDRYKEAMNELKKEEGGDSGRSLKLQAMHELGNILFYMNDIK